MAAVATVHHGCTNMKKRPSSAALKCRNQQMPSQSHAVQSFRAATIGQWIIYGQQWCTLHRVVGQVPRYSNTKERSPVCHCDIPTTLPSSHHVMALLTSLYRTKPGCYDKPVPD
jgi:hypothetical protein